MPGNLGSVNVQVASGANANSAASSATKPQEAGSGGTTKSTDHNVYFPGDDLYNMYYDNTLRNFKNNQNTDVQFRPFYKNPDASRLNIYRTPQWEAAEDRAFAEFKYVPERGETWDRASGRNKIWRDYEREQDRRYKRAFTTPYEYMPVGTNVELPWIAEQRWNGRPDKPKRRRLAENITDPVLHPVEPPIQKFNVVTSGTHRPTVDSYKIDYNPSDYMYTVNSTNPAYFKESVDTHRTPRSKYSREKEGQLYLRKADSKYYNMSQRIYKNSFLKQH